MTEYTKGYLGISTTGTASNTMGHAQREHEQTQRDNDARRRAAWDFANRATSNPDDERGLGLSFLIVAAGVAGWIILGILGASIGGILALGLILARRSWRQCFISFILKVLLIVLIVGAILGIAFGLCFYFSY